MKADPKSDGAAGGSKKKLLVIIIAGVVILGAAGGTAFVLTRGGGHEKTEEKKAKKTESAEPQFVQIEPFTVNLQPENGEQYLQIQFTLQVGDPGEVELFKKHMPKVRSRLLLLLSGKKASEINSVEGKRQLATDIVAVLKQPFADKGEPQNVSEVLFTSFIIQ